MGEGGGFPQVRAMVSLVSPKSPVARPSTKGVPESELTNLWLVGCKSEELSKACPSSYSNLGASTCPFTPFSVGGWERAPRSKQFRCVISLDPTWV